MLHGVRLVWPSAAQQDDDVDEQQADEDEGEVDEEFLQVPLDLGSHLDHGCSTYGRLGHVLDTLHGDRLDFDRFLLRKQRAGSGCWACLQRETQDSFR